MTTQVHTFSDKDIHVDSKERLSEGSFGIVFKATHKTLGTVVLKEIDLSPLGPVEKKIVQRGEINIFKYISTDIDCTYIVRL